VSTLVCDLADRAESSQLVEQVVAARSRLDILINSAGVIQVGPIEHMQTADFEDAINVHFCAPLQTMRAAIPVMRGLGGGRIVNISSIG
jgi:NAD(P)-dependent dehydrogenase (short-subunit alcohol dehydrogenase family)